MNVTAEMKNSLDKAKIGIFTLANSIFISTILFSLKFRWTDEIPTAATNGKQLLINPEFWNELTHDEHVFLLLHEAWHVAFEHMVRAPEDVNFLVWNMAGDYVINAILLKQGLKMPKGGLYDVKYEGWTTEEVYKDLMLDPPEPPEGFMADLQNPGDEDAKGLQESVQETIIRASVRAKMGGEGIGQLPGEIQRWIEQMLNPKLPWNVILQQFMLSLIPQDYTFRKCNRRFLPQAYLPTLHSEGLGKIIIAIDTSGSITPNQLEQFATEAYHIIAALQPKQTLLRTWDWSMYDILDVQNASDLKTHNYEGGGGTEVDPVIQWITEEQADVAIIFTDGYFCIEETTTVPVVWAVHSNTNFEAPFGRVIEYPLEA